MRTIEPLPSQTLSRLDERNGGPQVFASRSLVGLLRAPRLLQLAKSGTQALQRFFLRDAIDRQPHPDLPVEGLEVRLEFGGPRRAVGASVDDVREEAGIGIEGFQNAFGYQRRDVVYVDV